MSDESQVDETAENEEGTDEQLEAAPELTQDELLKEVAKLRREAASRRVANKEKDARLKEYDDWKKSQMTEVDRAKAETAELQSTVRELLSEKNRNTAAAKAGLDLEFADRILGDTLEEMTADAKRLAASLGKTAPRKASDALAGQRGKGVGQNAVPSENDWLLAELRK